MAPVIDIRLDWLGGNKGVLRADEVKDQIYVSLAPMPCCPETWDISQLFLAFLTTHFMAAYLDKAAKADFRPSRLEFEVRSEEREGVHRISLRPQVYILTEGEREKADQILRDVESAYRLDHPTTAQITCTGIVRKDIHPPFPYARPGA